MAKSKKKVLLFLCTGNYYRSRFAEIRFNAIVAKLGIPWQATSRGLALERGVNNVGPIATAVVTALEKHGPPDRVALARMPTQVAHDDFTAADLVVALKRAEHLPLLKERFPEWADKVETWHIDDAPEALALIERDVLKLVARLLGGGKETAESATAPADLPGPEPARKPLTAKVGRETKGRRGKGVTTVFELALDDAGLRELAATLKQKCGTGGTLKDGRIEIQGDLRDRVTRVLEEMGFRVKRVGG